MTDWLAIVNPCSGRGAGSPSFRPILEGVERATERVVFTEGPGHARELASDAGGYRGLAVVGGDGTLHEVLAGADLGMQRVAIVPTGRGNSLARDLGLSSALLGVRALEENGESRIDLMEVSLETESGRRLGCWAASTVALGYPVAVTLRADHSFRAAGKYCYLAAAVLESALPKPFAIDVSYDGAPASRCRLTGLVANNTRHLASFVGFPDGACDDGWFDVLELDAGFAKQTLHNLSALRGRRSTVAVPFRCRALEARLAEPAPVMVDGQIYGNVAALSIRVAPAALECHRGER